MIALLRRGAAASFAA